MMEDLVGKVVDNTYRIEKLLGQGGMGAVFKALDIALDRDVAIKVMHPHISRQQGFRDRFLQEARAIANLDHPGIVQVYTFSRNPEMLYIAMAFIAGQNLRDWLHLLSEKGVIVASSESLAIIGSVADALAYAHRRGVYHRDIKPGNIILRPLEAGQTSEAGLSFQPVVTDFGLAKLAEGGIRSVTGMSMGTPAYMAPEQCEGLQIDGRADIYALGIVLYELVTGRVPFPVKSLTEAIRAHTKEPPPPPRSVAPELPSQVEEIILTALAKSPNDRYRTAEEMARAVRVARQSLPHLEEATLAATQQGYASLVTMMSQEAPSPAPESEAWPTPPSEIPTGGRVVLLGPDGRSRGIPIGSKARLTIGRDEDNDIVLPDPKASRHHAQITLEGGKALLTDLNSTNGTFLGTTRLLPGVSEQWTPVKSVRIGGSWLRLEMPDLVPPQPTREPSFAGTPTPAPAAEPIHIVMDPTRVSVRPGESVDITVRVLNRQHLVDHFITMVERVSAQWVTRPEGSLRLAPGDTGTVTLRLHPPRTPASRAGGHDFVVRVVSRANPAHAAEVTGTLDVESFHDVKLDLTQTTFTNVGKPGIRISNMGNAPETVDLTASDASNALAVVPAISQLTLQAGQQQEIALPVGPRGKRPLMGTPQTHVFNVTATTADGEIAATQGSVTVKPYLPTWAIPLLTTLALLICAGGALAYTTAQKNKAAKATAQALLASNQTATLIAGGQQSATLTAEALHAEQTVTAEAMSAAEVQTATAAVATATAEWLGADSDGDGLTNAQEMQWGTDPNNRDSDGDTLPDGLEVQMGISPMSKDTDGDGVQDNVDPDPGKLPSPTPPPTDTPEPTATWTPTPVPSATATSPPTGTPTPKPYFQPNQTKSFSFSANPLGKLSKVCLKHNNSGPSPDWYVEWVEVDAGSGYEKFTFNRWIATDKEDGNLEACKQKVLTPVIIVTPIFKISKTLAISKIIKVTPKIGIIIGTPKTQTLKLRIKTGSASGAGTNSKVSVRVYGADGNTGWKTLN